MSETLADDIQPNPDVPRSGRAVAWDRRRASARGMWRGLRNDRLAMAGLIVLVLFALMAFAAPLLSDKSSLSAANTGDNPVWAPPSWSSCSAPTISGTAWRPSSCGAAASACSSA